MSQLHRSLPPFLSSAPALASWLRRLVAEEAYGSGGLKTLHYRNAAPARETPVVDLWAQVAVNVFEGLAFVFATDAPVWAWPVLVASKSLVGV